MHTPKDSIAHRKDKLRRGKLSTVDQFKLVEPYLPQPPTEGSDTDTPTSPEQKSSARLKEGRRRKPIRTLVRFTWHRVIFLIIHLFFSLYIRSRQTFRLAADRIATLIWYHYHSSDQIARDVQGLQRLPKHLSVVLHYQPEHEGGTGLTGLVDGAADVAAWAAAAGINYLSIYERRGLLKRNLAYTQSSIRRKFHTYFVDPPTTSIRGPQSSPESSPFSSPPQSPDLAPSGDITLASTPPAAHLSILLISEEDSRASVVDLTRTLTILSQNHKLSPDDINTSLLDNELQASVMGEPDLLLLFGPTIKLEGYPVWQVRVTEIFYKKDVGGSRQVSYQVFLKGLKRFSTTVSRLGR